MNVIIRVSINWIINYSRHNTEHMHATIIATCSWNYGHASLDHGD
jgi:hypothetical protein